MLDSSRWPTSANHQPVVIGQPHISLPPTLPPPPVTISPPPDAASTSTSKRASSPDKLFEISEATGSGEGRAIELDVSKMELKQEAATPTSKQSPWPHKMRPQTLWMQNKESQKGPKQAVVPPQREGLVKAGAGPPQATVAPQLPKATVAPQQHRKLSAESPATPESHLQSSQSADLGSSGRPSGRTAPSGDPAAAPDPAADPETSRGVVPHPGATPVLPSLPVTTPHAFPLVYPSAVPYLCDPSLLQRLPFAPPPTSTQDRATSPIQFDLDPSTTSSSTATDDLIPVQSSAVQTASTPSQHQAIQTTPSEPPLCSRCRASSSSSPQHDTGNTSPPAKAPDCSSPRPKPLGQSSPRPKGVADYLFDLSGPMLSQIEAEEDSKNLSQPQSPCSSVSQGAEPTTEDRKPRDLLSLIPQVSQVSDGLELLSILAEHAQKEQQGSQGSNSTANKTGEGAAQTPPG